MRSAGGSSIQVPAVPPIFPRFTSMHFLKHTPIRTITGFLRASVFLLTFLIFLAACTPKTSDPAGNAVPQNSAKKLQPIAPSVVQKDVEHQEAFQEVRKAACPRRIPDRIEARPPFPAINILEGLQYVTISDDTSQGMYEKVIELTDTGRQTFADQLEEEPNRYIITIAQREYLPGFERYENAPGRTDRIVVSFQWQWKPLNPLGERLNLWAPYSDRNEHQGRATYVETGGVWKLDEVWLDRNHRDYVGGVYK
ncbi:MAG: hypothetical protein HY774_14180 [Acidobacteria bacterium]|nr:hypothetical protein [Acidobacteriota bacterium]